MPYKAKTPCKHPGCPNLTDRGYCEKHIKEHNREYNHWHLGISHRNDMITAGGKLVPGMFQATRFVRCVLKEGRYVSVAEVHHIKPKSEGGSDGFENLMSLCHSCHMKIHSFV